jgi:hypothetical protein
MNKFILTLFFLWIVWKALKSVIEEIQRRAEKMSSGQGGRPDLPAPQAARRPAPRPSPEPEEWELGEPIPGGEESELERWYREAMERKRKVGRTVQPAPPPSARERMRAQPARPRRAEPRIARRREPVAEQVRVVPPREPVAPRPAPERWQAPPQPPEPRKFRQMRRREARGERTLAELVEWGEWDLDDVRRGIIIAEILGPAKALKDIDTHVI